MPKLRLQTYRDKRAGKTYHRVVVKDETVNTPNWFSYNPWDDWDPGPVPFHGPLLTTDLFLVMKPDEFKPETLARIEQMRLDREAKLNEPESKPKVHGEA